MEKLEGGNLLDPLRLLCAALSHALVTGQVELLHGNNHAIETQQVYINFLTNISCVAYCVLLKEAPRDSSVSHNEQDVLAPILIYQDLPM